MGLLLVLCRSLLDNPNHIALEEVFYAERLLE